MFVVERYISDSVKIYEKHPVSTGGSTWDALSSMWIPETQASHSFFLREKPVRKNMQYYIKNGNKECLDDYFPCRIRNCKLKHIKN